MQKVDRTVVIASSLDVESDEVLRVGVQVAESLGAHPLVVHAYQPPAFAPTPFGPVGNEMAWLETHYEDLQRRLKAQCARVELPVETSIRLQMGAPFEVVLQIAELTHAELIVAGSLKGGKPHAFGLGSTVDRLVRHGACPVMVVRAGGFHPPRQVVFPVDCSPLSGGGLRLGLELLDRMGVERTRSSALFILHPLEAEGTVQFTPMQLERFAADEVERFVRDFAGERLPVRVRSGHARQAIVAELDEKGVDLAVLSTRGLTGLERLLIGSVASSVIRDSPCNLLVIPAALADAASRSRASVDTSARERPFQQARVLEYGRFS